MNNTSNYLLLAIIAYATRCINKPKVTLRVLNNCGKPIKNSKILLVGCNKKRWVITDSKGYVYLFNIAFGIYEARLYSSKDTFLYERIKILSPGYYTVNLNKYSSVILHGKIYNEINGEYIASAIVILFKYDKISKSYLPIRKTITDENGYYCFKNITSGKYFIKSIK